MPRHQHGIFAEGTIAHHHIELSIHDGVDDSAVAAAIGATRLANAAQRTNGGVALVVGFGPALTARLDPDGSQIEMAGFPGYGTADGAHEAPATQHDAWVWVHGPSTDLVIDVVRRVVAAWRPIAEVVLDLPSFVYHDSRDLTGFIDGTANPPLDDAPVVAVVPDGTPGSGGCFAMTMEFVHDLDAFHALEVSDQERVFGRTKGTSEELEGAAKPADAHISRVEVDDDQGDELKVYRRSVPWANGIEQGLHFVAFGSDIDRFDLQLRHQYGLVDDGITDRLLDFTTPRTGSFWFCPSVEALDAIAPINQDDG